MERDFSNQSKPDNPLRAWVVPTLLALILLLGAVFRLTGVNWDEDQHLHPDERFLTMVESALSLPGVKDIAAPPPPGCAKWGGYFDTPCSPLNPYNHNFGLFVYGTFPIFLTRVVGELIEQAGYGQIHLVGRVLSALFDLSTVLLIFFIGRRLYGARAALLGAFFLAASVLDIQQSHFFTVDTFTNVPILIAFWYALDVADGKKWHAFVFAGAAFGLALAGRINIAPFAAVLIAVAALRAYRAAASVHRRKTEPPTATEPGERLRAEASRWRALEEGPEALPAPESNTPTVASVRRREVEPPTATEPGEHLRMLERSVGPVSVTIGWRNAARSFEDSLSLALTRAFFGLAGAAIVTLVVFRIAQPYAANGPNFISPSLPELDLSRGAVNFLLDVALSWAGGVNPKFADNMTYINELVNGRQDYPPGHQWTNRTPYVFPFQNMVLWGLGPPLGLAAWAGFAFALYRLIRHREWQHLPIVVWVGITFGYSGQQWVKTMRYFLQIYPFLALLAGFFLIWLWERAAGSSKQQAASSKQQAGSGLLARGAVAIIALIVIGYTLFWAGAFTTIYTRPVSRVAASRWMFENIPQGSVIANEHWDDGLPLRVDGKDPFGGMYRGIEMHWYAEDTPEKRTQAIQWLDSTDSIVLSSNRLYGSIPRLPMRYPLTTQYYQWLFDGTLGFDLAATVTSRPQLFGIEIADDDADEAFTVYDHPKVLIFKKTPRYSHENTAALFNGVDLTEVYRFWPREATQAPTALLLTPGDWDAQLRGGTWSQIFKPDDWMNRAPVLVWLAIIELLGWLAFPIAFAVFRALADRGYIFAKALGILLTAWGAWLLASVHALPFSRKSVVLVIALIAIVAVLMVWRRGRELLAFAREQRVALLVEEILFLMFFGAFLAIRYGNPDLWHPWFGGEKPMDFTLLNAIIKSTWFPPYDAWFAGGYINYYYFGQLITATLVRLSGIVPEVAYNLALPTFFALTAMGAFSVAFNLVRNSKFVFAVSLLAALLVAVIGNLGELVLIGQTFAKIGGGDQGSALAILANISVGIWRVLVERQPFEVPIGWWYWNATRVIPETINEFPFFTFLYADLHAHLIALPFTLLMIGVTIHFVLRERDETSGVVTRHLRDLIEVSIAALVLGGLRAINFADFATYLLLIACALAIGEYARRQVVDWHGIVAVAWRLIAIVVLSSVFYQPFNSHFATAYVNIELWQGKRTGLAEYLVVHGIFLFPVATFLVLQTFDTKTQRGVFRFLRMARRHFARLEHMLSLQRTLYAPAPLYEDFTAIVVFISFGVEILLLLAHLFVFAFVFPLLVLAALLVLRPDLAAPRRFIALLIAAALAMTLMVEVIVYKGDIGRMNTVFKFYLQVWVFLGIAAATGLGIQQQAASRQQAASSRQQAAGSRRQAADNRQQATVLPQWWWGIFVLLLIAGFLYPVFATRAKVNDRFVAETPAGLNGMDYMRTAVYHDQNREILLEYDRQAIEWLRQNVVSSPVILEGNAPLYHWASRISSYTGLPTVIGWDWHQKQQRSIIDGAIIDRRIETVRNIYNTRNAADALAMMKRFRVSYIYVGDVERAFYDAHGLAKFDEMARAGQLDVVYQNERVKIYRIPAP